ncbi:MAG: hypothetical protein Q8N63_06350 [Nanoarchaeota archaeon]|nr:hypothetical protein [Nanoarchaeota archaeon]
MVEGDSPWDYVDWKKAKKSFAKLLIKHDLVKLININLKSHDFQWETELGDGSGTDVYTGIIESEKTFKWFENNQINDAIWPFVGEIKKGYVEIFYEYDLFNGHKSERIILPEQVIEAARFSAFLKSSKIPYKENLTREQTIDLLEKLTQRKVRELSLLLDKSKIVPYKTGKDRKQPTLESLQRQKAGRISACIEAKMALYGEEYYKFGDY